MSQVWPVIEQANAEAPTHSRLLPEMVEFLPYVSLCGFTRRELMERTIQVWYAHPGGHQDEHTPTGVLCKVQEPYRYESCFHYWIHHDQPVFRKHLRPVRPD